jgi:hypothetical protein
MYFYLYRIYMRDDLKDKKHHEKAEIVHEEGSQGQKHHEKPKMSMSAQKKTAEKQSFFMVQFYCTCNCAFKKFSIEKAATPSAEAGRLKSEKLT